jgi:hypothetical protein
MANNLLDLGSLLEIQKNLVVNAPTEENDINRINSVISNLNGLSASTDQGVNDIRKIITRQAEIQEIVDTEQAVLERNKQNADHLIVSQKREIELTDNHRKRMAEYNKIIMIIILGLSTVVVMNILKSKISFLPTIVFDILIIIVMVYTIIVCFGRHYNIQARSLSNFDQLQFNPPVIDSAESVKQKRLAAEKSGDLLGSIASSGCVGRACCDTGTTWDTVKLRCVEAFNTLATSTHSIQIASPYTPSEFDQYAPVM